MPDAPLELEPLPGGMVFHPLEHQERHLSFIRSPPAQRQPLLIRHLSPILFRVSHQPHAHRTTTSHVYTPFPHDRPYPIRATKELDSLLKSLTKLTSHPLALLWFVVSSNIGCCSVNIA